MRKQRKFWTRERIIEALVRFGAEHGTVTVQTYEKIAKATGAGRVVGDRPFPTGYTIRSEFPALADAWLAAGLEPPIGFKTRKSKTKTAKSSRPRSVAFVSAEDAAASRVLDAAVLGRAITEQVPCPDCAALRSERDEVAWALGQLLTGDETAIRLVRAGRIGREAKS